MMMSLLLLNLCTLVPRDRQHPILRGHQSLNMNWGDSISSCSVSRIKWTTIWGLTMLQLNTLLGVPSSRGKLLPMPTDQLWRIMKKRRPDIFPLKEVLCALYFYFSLRSMLLSKFGGDFYVIFCGFLLIPLLFCFYFLCLSCLP